MVFKAANVVLCRVQPATQSLPCVMIRTVIAAPACHRCNALQGVGISIYLNHDKARETHKQKCSDFNQHRADMTIIHLRRRHRHQHHHSLLLLDRASSLTSSSTTVTTTAAATTTIAEAANLCSYDHLPLPRCLPQRLHQRRLRERRIHQRRRIHERRRLHERRRIRERRQFHQRRIHQRRRLLERRRRRRRQCRLATTWQLFDGHSNVEARSDCECL